MSNLTYDLDNELCKHLFHLQNKRSNAQNRDVATEGGNPRTLF